MKTIRLFILLLLVTSIVEASTLAIKPTRLFSINADDTQHCEGVKFLAPPILGTIASGNYTWKVYDINNNEIKIPGTNTNIGSNLGTGNETLGLTSATIGNENIGKDLFLVVSRGNFKSQSSDKIIVNKILEAPVVGNQEIDPLYGAVIPITVNRSDFSNGTVSITFVAYEDTSSPEPDVYFSGSFNFSDTEFYRKASNSAYSIELVDINTGSGEYKFNLYYEPKLFYNDSDELTNNKYGKVISSTYLFDIFEGIVSDPQKKANNCNEVMEITFSSFWKDQFKSTYTGNTNFTTTSFGNNVTISVSNEGGFYYDPAETTSLPVGFYSYQNDGEELNGSNTEIILPAHQNFNDDKIYSVLTTHIFDGVTEVESTSILNSSDQTVSITVSNPVDKPNFIVTGKDFSDSNLNPDDFLVNDVSITTNFNNKDLFRNGINNIFTLYGEEPDATGHSSIATETIDTGAGNSATSIVTYYGDKQKSGTYNFDLHFKDESESFFSVSESYIIPNEINFTSDQWDRYVTTVTESYHDAKDGIINTSFNSNYEYSLKLQSESGSSSTFVPFDSEGDILAVETLFSEGNVGTYEFIVQASNRDASEYKVKNTGRTSLTIERKQALSGSVNINTINDEGLDLTKYHYPLSENHQMSFSIIPGGGSESYEIYGVTNGYEQEDFQLGTDGEYFLQNFKLNTSYTIFLMDNVDKARDIWVSTAGNIKSSVIDDSGTKGYFKKESIGQITNQLNLLIDELKVYNGVEDRTDKALSGHINCFGESVNLIFTIDTRARGLSQGIDQNEIKFALIPKNGTPTLINYNEDNTISVNIVTPQNYDVQYDGVVAGEYDLWVLEHEDLFLDGTFNGYKINTTTIEITQPSEISITFEKEPSTTNQSASDLFWYKDDADADQFYHVSRNGGTDGTFYVNFDGGVGNYSFDLIDDSGNEVKSSTTISGVAYQFDALEAGTYKVGTFSDQSICTVIPSNTNDQYTVEAPDALTFTTSAENKGGLTEYQVSGNNQSDGVITINVSDGIPDYSALIYKYDDTGNSYQLIASKNVDDFRGSHSFTGLSAGDYKIVVKDKYYTFGSSIATVTDFSTAFPDTDNTTGDVVVSGVVTLNEPPPLAITVKALDFNASNNTLFVDIDDSEDTEQLHVQCNFGAKAYTGVVQVEISGGIPYYVQADNNIFYKLSYEDGDGNSISTTYSATYNATEGKYISETKTHNALPAGEITITYEAFSKDVDASDVEHDDKSVAYDLQAPEALAIEFKAPELPTCITGTPVTGDETTNGILKLSVEGGIFLRNADQRYYNVFTQHTTYPIYSDTVSQFRLADNGNHISSTLQIKVEDRYNCPCKDITLTPEYSNSIYDETTRNDNQTEIQTIATAVKNDDTVEEPTTFPYFLSDYPPIEADIVSNWTSCKEGEDGSLVVSNLIGGTGQSYQVGLFVQGSGTPLQETTKNASDEFVFNNLPQGNYEVKVIFDKCQFYRPIDTISLTYINKNNQTTSIGTITNAVVEVKEPVPVELTLSDVNIPTCKGINNGSFDLSVEGGYAPYTVRIWQQDDGSEGVVYHDEEYLDAISVGTSTGLENTSPVAFSINNLLGGKYYKIYIEDALGCTHVERYINFENEKYSELGIDEPNSNSDDLYGTQFLQQKHLYSSLSLSSKKTSCEASADGEILLSVNNVLTNTFQVRWVRNRTEFDATDVKTVSAGMDNLLAFNGLENGSYSFQYNEGGSCGWKDFGPTIPITSLPDITASFIENIIPSEQGCGLYSLRTGIASTAVPITFTLQKEVAGSWNDEDKVVGSNNAVETFSNLGAGTYRIGLSYHNACDTYYSDSYTLGNFVLNTIDLENQITCWNDLGSIAVSARLDGNLVQGDVNYILYKLEGGNYVESTSNTLGVFESLEAGDYYVKATKGADVSCLQTSEFTYFSINIPDALQLNVQADNTLPVRCSGSYTATAIVNITGGVAPYTLSVSDGFSDEREIEFDAEGTYNIENLSWGGDYSFILVDGDCSDEVTGNLTFDANDIVLNATPADKDYCALNTGSVDIELQNISNNVEVILDGEFYQNINTLTFTISNLEAGQHSIKVTDLTTSCESEVIEFNIEQETKGYYADYEVVASPNCDSEDGEVNLLVKDLDDNPLNINDFTILWVEDNLTSVTRSDLGKGIHKVMLTDQRGCQEELTVQLNAINAAAFEEDIALRELPYCNQPTGEVVIKATSGKSPFSFVPYEGITVLDQNTTTGTFRLGGLKVDEEYNFELRDASCESYITIKIEDEKVGHVFGKVAGNVTPASCGKEIGSYELTSYAEEDYSIEWLGTSQKGKLLENVLAGDYEALIIHNDTQCDTTIQISIGERSAVVLALVATDSSNCGLGTGSIEVIASGGGNSYSYEWKKGNFEFDEKSELISDLFSGVYHVTAYDQYGCSSNTLRITIQDRETLKAVLLPIQNSTCKEVNDGEMQVIVSGGLAPYEFNWDNTGFVEGKDTNTALASGNHVVIVKDQRGCTFETNIVTLEADDPIKLILEKSNPTCFGASDGTFEIAGINKDASFINTLILKDSLDNVVSTSGYKTLFEGLSSGEYILEVISNSGCTVNASVKLEDPDPLKLELDYANQPKCLDGTDGRISVNTIGGSGDFTYLWTNQAGQTVGNASLLENVGVGTYSLKVTDNNSSLNCSADGTFTIEELDTLSIAKIDLVSPKCNGNADGSIEIRIQGGEAPYQIEWDGFNNFTNKLNNITVGDYRVIITDRNACVKDTVISLVEQPDPLQVTVISKTDASCDELSDGSAEIFVQGGTLPYTIKWNNNQRGTSLQNVSKGTYFVDVTDRNGCTFERVEVQINAPDPIVGEIIELTDPSCVGAFDGSVVLKATGGTKDYILTSTNAVFIESLTDSTFKVEGYGQGLYDLQLTDKNACRSNFISFRLNDPASIQVDSVKIVETSCFGSEDGSITVHASGGTNNLSYVWDNGRIGNFVDGLSAGKYTVYISDIDKGCEESKTYTVTSPSALEGEIAQVVNPTCVEGGDASIALSISGGTAPYTYEWSNGMTTESIENLASGSYSVVVTDKNGCSITLSQEIIDPDPIVVDIHNLTDFIEICEGAFYTIDAGSQWKDVRWTSDRGLDDFNRTLIITEAGNYTLHLTTTEGCETTYDFEVVHRDDLLIPQFLIDHSAQEKFDTYVIVDLTQPVPDDISWTIEPQIEVVDSTDYTYEIRFTQAGEYTIRQRSVLAGCVAEKVQTVNVGVFAGGRFGIIGDNVSNEKEEIRIFEVTPNPSKGTFSVYIGLSEQMNAYVSLHQMNGLKLWDQSLKNSDHYEIKYSNEKLPTGMYLLKLHTLKGVKVLKVMIGN
ncbi:T9SS type A sorting domain-containing protein [Flammeovirga sp. SJP92]|uniref:T9SS type A sorting domain-containing protein n=1 Tax=Flammeovirga sp. SJP92 TaxID=1775430 RepID=UPI00156045CA|nr:T9SS type A sorting domain-containing protein [Flammeovirga sp. SJP92]